MLCRSKLEAGGDPQSVPTPPCEITPLSTQPDCKVPITPCAESALQEEFADSDHGSSLTLLVGCRHSGFATHRAMDVLLIVNA
jgi:hypothetical protein